jgi:hypothetical protein
MELANMLDDLFVGVKQIVWGVIALFAVILLTSIACWFYQSGEISRLENQVADLQESQKRANQALARRETLRAGVEKTHKAASAALSQAAASQPAWADTPVPQEIQDAIR